MNLGISTVYFSRKIIKKLILWEEIKSELFKLGVDSLELNADIPIEWMNKIYQDVKKQEIKVLTLHNFCPAVENIPEGKYGFNVYSLTSPDEVERDLAVKYTLRTIDYANYLEAKAVILHLGEIFTQPSGIELYKFVSDFGINSKLYQEYKNSFITTRNLNKNKYFNFLYKSLDQIITYAEEKKVNLAIETRFFPNEIPNFEEIKEIIDHYKSKHLYYWHDFGHAEIQNKLGFSHPHFKYFETYSKYLIGYHIHNLSNLEDHKSPHLGEINFKEMLNYNENRIYILEVHSKENFNSLKEGVNFIKSILEKQKNYERIPS
ncbi:MAG: sugar phosphate isomerase/epimerase [Endomicrobia bacterium]|nr:sugar phosphate isomerase/epimerase [Endomicrobiia bacterium]